MAVKKSKVEIARQIASKLKKPTKKSSAVKRYEGQGQNAPQSKAWTEPTDESVKAKAIGYRWSKEGAKRLGKTETSKPSREDIEKYKNKSFKIKGETNRYLYSEKRVDKSDKSIKAKFKKGGQTAPQSPSYRRSNDKKIEAKPVGWRFKGNNYNTPTDAQRKRDLQRDPEDRRIYFENRKDKSDFDFYDKLAKGGQTAPQSPSYRRSNDKKIEAKPVGWRFKGNNYETPTDAQRKRDLKKDPEDRRIYFENRKDKSDFDFYDKLEDGGMMAKGGGVRQFGSQSGNPTRSADKVHQEKPVGWRFRGNKYRKPSQSHINQQLKLSPDERDIYFERRKDKSDYDFDARLERGGALGKTNSQRVKNLVKDLDNTPHSIGIALLRERLYTWSENDLKTLNENPDAWNVGFFGSGMYRDLFERIIKFTSFDDDKYEDGGFAQGGMNEYARGGVERIANSQAREYTENMLPFKGANLEGKVLDNGDYVVLSYGYYPIWWYCKSESKWYGNTDKYSQTTAKHMSQSRPTYDATMLSNSDLSKAMMKGSAKFEDGGALESLMGDINAPVQNVGGTMFSTTDLTSHLDLSNPAF
jgi:hypothetical protein